MSKTAKTMLWLAPLLAGCQTGPPGVSLWVFRDPLDRGALDPSPPLEPSGTEATLRASTLALEGAVNETLSFCLGVRSSAGIARPDLRPQRFEGVGTNIPPDGAQIYRMHDVRVSDWPGWHVRNVPPAWRVARPLDVLVPLRAPRGGMPGSLGGGKTVYFWVDLPIPKGTFAGVYNGALDVTSGEEVVATLPLQVTVHPFMLPDDTEPLLIADVDHRKLFRHHVEYHGRPYAPGVDDWREDPRRDELNEVLKQTMRKLRRHRLTPTLPHLNPTWNTGSDGTLVVGWQQYDEIAGPWLDGADPSGAAPLAVWPVPLRPVASAARTGQAGPRSTQTESVTKRYLAHCGEHFAVKGWLDRSYAALLNPTASMVEYQDFAALIATGADRIPLLTHWFPHDPRPYGWFDFEFVDLSGVVDIWMPAGQFFEPAAMARRREAGERTWFAIDRPPYTGSTSVYASAGDARVIAWQAEEMGAEAIHLGTVNDWPEAETYPAPRDCLDADPESLLFPGGPFGLNEPVPSVRLKRLRQSAEDATFRAMLRSQSLGHVARTLRQSLAPFGGTGAYRTHLADARPIPWPGEDEVFRAARAIMATELAKRAQTTPSGDDADFARSVEWRRFVEGTNRVDARVEGVRVRLFGESDRTDAELECALTLSNSRRTAVASTLGFAALPDGWTSETPNAEITVPAGESRRAVLRAGTDSLATGPGAHLRIPLEMTGEALGVTSLSARASCVAAMAIEAPIHIDGRLNEWPAGSTSVAGDFRLIAPAARRDSGERQRVPRHATQAYLLRDDKYLYVGVTCEGDATHASPTSGRKRVHHEDMIPLGEDLIELLFDPLNAGTRSPADLYHLVIKRSGPWLARKGIELDPPCGPSAPWPASIEYAVAESRRGQWSVEIRIPLDALDAPATEATTWGFNITRLDAANQEYSTWSGATCNAYDPLSLGNLYLP